MRFDTDDSILMRRHRAPSLGPIRTRHLEPVIRRAPDVNKGNLLTNLVIIGLGILIAGAMLAAALPHH